MVIVFIAGRHCSHEETASSGAIALDCNRNLQDYLDTLTVSCQGDASEAAILTWTPDENTPDVVYYQVGCSYRNKQNITNNFDVHPSVLITFTLVGGLNSLMLIPL